jgi:DNA (cytosine-5)-methyltransferase 1
MATAADLFAGMGGFTEGAERAGVRVLVAANHWPAAVECHKANHPETEHVCQDLRQANFYDWPDFDLLLASPSCTGHSRARGKNKPKHQGDRSTAWAVIDCVEAKRPEVVICENVVEWVRAWPLFPAWRIAMQALGYAVSPHVVNAADYGVPQDRERVIVICTRSANPFMLRDRRGTANVPAARIIEWDAEGWRPIGDDLAPRTLRRIEHGRRTFGERFVFSYYGNTTTARSIERPVGTITTKDRWAVVEGDRMRMFNVRECAKAQDFPADYVLPPSSTLAKFMIGNAIPPGLAYGALSEVLEAA